jgi:hypothetical protein
LQLHMAGSSLPIVIRFRLKPPNSECEEALFILVRKSEKSESLKKKGYYRFEPSQR